MVPAGIVADLDDAGLTVDDTADGDSDALEILVGALKDLNLFGDEVEGGFGGGRGTDDDGIEEGATHSGDGKAGLPTLDFYADGAEGVG